MTFFGHNKDRPPVPGGAVAAAIAGSFSYFARDLSLELAPTRVNVVSPGWVDTPMFDELVGEAKARLLRDPSRPLAGGKDRDTSGHRPRLHLRHGKRLHVWRDHSHRRRQPPFLQVTKGRPAAHRLHRLSFLSGHQGMVRGEWRWPEGRARSSARTHTAVKNTKGMTDDTRYRRFRVDRVAHAPTGRRTITSTSPGFGRTQASSRTMTSNTPCLTT
jgi:hypothetical protein